MHAEIDARVAAQLEAIRAEAAEQLATEMARLQEEAEILAQHARAGRPDGARGGDGNAQRAAAEAMAAESARVRATKPTATCNAWTACDRKRRPPAVAELEVEEARSAAVREVHAPAANQRQAHFEDRLSVTLAFLRASARVGRAHLPEVRFPQPAARSLARNALVGAMVLFLVITGSAMIVAMPYGRIASLVPDRWFGDQPAAAQPSVAPSAAATLREPVGDLSVQSTPGSAQVLLDGKMAGTTPSEARRAHGGLTQAGAAGRRRDGLADGCRSEGSDTAPPRTW